MSTSYYLTIGLLLGLTTSCASTVRPDCNSVAGDDQLNVDSWRRQSASLLITWFLPLMPTDTNQTNSATGDQRVDDIELLRNLFNKTIESRVAFELVATKQLELNMIKSVDTNITLTTFDLDEGADPLSYSVVETLLKLLDCSKGRCKISRDDYSSYHYQVNMRAQSHWFDEYNIHHLNPINVYLHLTRPLLTSDGECGLCEALIQSNSFVFTATSWLNKILSILKSIVALLEPQHWLYLILAIWLSVCFIIAMLIKSRDKRRLRLYLEERADYSFSAKR